MGKRYAGPDPTPISAAHAAAFADAIGSTNPRFRGADAIAPPILAAVDALGALTTPLLDPALRADMMRLEWTTIDARFFRPVLPGDALRSTCAIADVVALPAGERLDLDVQTKNAAGDDVVAVRSAVFLRGARQRVAARHEESDSSWETPWRDATSLWRRTWTVARDLGQRFARASGDHNPIFIDDEVARMAGLPGALLHRMCAMAFVHDACVDEAGGDPMRVRRLVVRWLRPALLGDELTVEARGPKDGPWLLRMSHQDDAAILAASVELA